MAPKVLTLPLLAVRLMLDLAHQEPALPNDIVTTLQTAAGRGPIEGNYQVALQPEDAAALSAWCRAIAPSLNPAHAGVLRVAADTIDAAKMT
jgi:hypothetical protein